MKRNLFHEAPAGNADFPVGAPVGKPALRPLRFTGREQVRMAQEAFHEPPRGVWTALSARIVSRGTRGQNCPRSCESPVQGFDEGTALEVEALHEPAIGSPRLTTRLGTALALGAGLLLTGCRGDHEPPPAIPREAIYARADLNFADVILFKPADPEHGSELQRKSTPLIMQEARGTNSVNDSPLTPIYLLESHVEWQGQKLEQAIYFWRYPPGVVTDSKPLPAQGIRVTHNPAGLPVIWEVLADSSGAELLFVSQNLEAAAKAEFGPPLLGRRFSVERDLGETPTVVVARVLSDSPVAMGPIVYLNRGTREVGTLICRCMEAQARNLVGEGTYDATVVTADEMASLIQESLPLGKFRRADWRAETAGTNRLERILRLPSKSW